MIKPFRRQQLLSTLAIAMANHQQQEKPEEDNLSGSTGHYRLQPTLDYIQNHLDQGITVEFLAGAIGMSTAYFCRFFQKEMGCSPYQFIIQQRVERAKIILLERELPISEVALRSGFSSHSQLNYHFRNLLGITPKEYRSR
ncbi:AraC family transcriptional regulator [Synechocystis salina]|uniref:AraC family transcriptional regulator n=1 Tax=Synechocystis salina TaxID=945780 RepID=UPI002AD59EBA|nr:AraC family transcriptional regulator [Synechocystis salina]